MDSEDSGFGSALESKQQEAALEWLFILETTKLKHTNDEAHPNLVAPETCTLDPHSSLVSVSLISSLASSSTTDTRPSSTQHPTDT